MARPNFQCGSSAAAGAADRRLNFRVNKIAVELLRVAWVRANVQFVSRTPAHTTPPVTRIISESWAGRERARLDWPKYNR